MTFKSVINDCLEEAAKAAYTIAMTEMNERLNQSQEQPAPTEPNAPTKQATQTASTKQAAQTAPKAQAQQPVQTASSAPKGPVMAM